MRFVIADSGGQITGVLFASTQALAEQQVLSGETLYAADDDLPFIDDTKLEVVDGVIVKKAGVIGDVPGDGLEVATIE